MAETVRLLQKLSIRRRIYLFFAIGVIALVLISVYAISAILFQSNRVTMIHQHPLTVSTNALSASEDVIRIHRAMKDYVAAISDLERQVILEKVEGLDQDVIDHLSIVEDRILGEKGQRLVSEVQHMYSDWAPIRKEVVNLVASGDHEQAISLSKTRSEEQVHMLEKRLSALKVYALSKADEFIAEAESEQDSTTTFLIWLVLIVIVLTVVFSVLIANSIIHPLKQIHALVTDLGQGKHPEIADLEGNDEIVRMNRSIGELIVGLQSTSAFAKSIGDGQLDADYEALGEADILGNSLLEMRDRLREVNVKENQQKWSTFGMAEFSELLRGHQDDLSLLSKELIAKLIEYLNANQAAIYLVRTHEGDEVLEMTACYAWDRLKYHEKRMGIHEGILGQAVLERKSIHLVNVPEDYVTIASGLGDAPPRNILIMPLLFNDGVFGVMEIASFTMFEDYQVGFVEELSVSIASTLSAVMTNQRTRELLEESREINQQIAAQEEEIRQNAEELQATQEEMARRSKTQQERIRELEKELEELRGNGDDA